MLVGIVNPECEISTRITAYTGITNDMVADARTIEEVLPDFKNFIGEGLLVVAHSVTFDYGFLNVAYKRLYGRTLDQKTDCTLTLHKSLQEYYKEYEGWTSHRLSSVVDNLLRYLDWGDVLEYKVSVHRALSDARVVSKIYPILLLKKECAEIKAEEG